MKTVTSTYSVNQDDHDNCNIHILVTLSTRKIITTGTSVMISINTRHLNWNFEGEALFTYTLTHPYYKLHIPELLRENLGTGQPYSQRQRQEAQESPQAVRDTEISQVCEGSPQD